MSCFPHSSISATIVSGRASFSTKRNPILPFHMSMRCGHYCIPIYIPISLYMWSSRLQLISIRESSELHLLNIMPFGNYFPPIIVHRFPTPVLNTSRFEPVLALSKFFLAFLRSFYYASLSMLSVPGLLGSPASRRSGFFSWMVPWCCLNTLLRP